jgi:uncharacterized membrane protein YvbJ
MSVCPICGSEDYDRDTGCETCGHYDEDRIGIQRRREIERAHQRRRERLGRRRSL